MLRRFLYPDIDLQSKWVLIPTDEMLPIAYCAQYIHWIDAHLFKCNWSKEYGKLIEKRLKEIIVPDEDYVLIFPRCEPALFNTMKIGKGSKIENHTLPFMVL